MNAFHTGTDGTGFFRKIVPRDGTGRDFFARLSRPVPFKSRPVQVQPFDYERDLRPCLLPTHLY